MWKPRRNGDKFWYVDIFLKPHKARMYNGDDDSIKLIRSGNCFRTRKDAQEASYVFKSYLLCKDRNLWKH